jgi:phenylacetate-CoA ligase
MAIWDEQHESIDRERLRTLQLTRLRGMLARLYERVPHYRAKLDGVGFAR